MMPPELIARLATIQIASLKEGNLPGDSASACVVRFPNKNILLTVAHATTRGHRWSLRCRYVPERKGTLQYQFGPIGYVKSLSLGKLRAGVMQGNEIDFAYSEIPRDLPIFYQEIQPDGTVIHETPRIVLPPRVTPPHKDQRFCFYGLALGELREDRTFVSQERIMNGLIYRKTAGYFHRFRCESGFSVAAHKGCSGAPIFDNSGNLVSLVVEGRGEKQEVWGLNLSAVWAMLLVEAGEFAQGRVK